MNWSNFRYWTAEQIRQYAAAEGESEKDVLRLQKLIREHYERVANPGKKFRYP